MTKLDKKILIENLKSAKEKIDLMLHAVTHDKNFPLYQDFESISAIYTNINNINSALVRNAHKNSFFKP